MNDIHEGDMALELSEYEFTTLAMPEILEHARRNLDREWLSKASRDPEMVRDAYFNLIGGNKR